MSFDSMGHPRKITADEEKNLLKEILVWENQEERLTFKNLDSIKEFTRAFGNSLTKIPTHRFSLENLPCGQRSTEMQNFLAIFGPKMTSVRLKFSNLLPGRRNRVDDLNGLLSVFALTLTELEIRFSKEVVKFCENYYPIVMAQVPKLSCLKRLSLWTIVGSSERSNLGRDFLSQIFKASPNLENLQLHVYEKEITLCLETLSSTEFEGSDDKGLVEKIKFLHLSDANEEHLIRLIEFTRRGMVLESLVIENLPGPGGGRRLLDVVNLQKESLKTLRVDQRGDLFRFEQNVNPSLPSMKKLRHLRLKIGGTITYGRFCFSRQFPNLKSLDLCPEEEVAVGLGYVHSGGEVLPNLDKIWSEEILCENVNSDPCNSLKRISIYGEVARKGNLLQRLNKFFPNVKELLVTIKNQEEASIIESVIWNTWSDLEVIEITALNPLDDFDTFVSGICQQKSVRKLCVRRGSCWSCDSTRGLLSDSTATGVLAQMESLREVEIDCHKFSEKAIGTMRKPKLTLRLIN